MAAPKELIGTPRASRLGMGTAMLQNFWEQETNTETLRFERSEGNAKVAIPSQFGHIVRSICRLYIRFRPPLAEGHQ